jgi:hypothetical protein
MQTSDGTIVKITNNVYKYTSSIQKMGGRVKDSIENTTSYFPLIEDYYEVNGFKFTQFYYDRLWKGGRPFPGFRAEWIFKGATDIIPDPRGYPDFYKYTYEGWEMIFNPITKIVAHMGYAKKGKP